jgi:hypothetical protein
MCTVRYGVQEHGLEADWRGQLTIATRTKDGFDEPLVGRLDYDIGLDAGD